MHRNGQWFREEKAKMSKLTATLKWKIGKGDVTAAVIKTFNCKALVEGDMHNY